MTPYHIARSQLFVRERFSKAVLSHLDTAEIEAYIEHTRFPVPEEEQHAPTDDFPGLLRAADLIGQLADINYLRKTSALFSEFRETGISTKLNLNSAAICGPITRTFSGRWYSPISRMPCVTLKLTKRANNGLLISTQTCF